jgi:extracellular matrix regulatory protein A
MSNKKKATTLISLGFSNVVVKDKIVAVVSPEAAPIKRLREEARQNKKLIDATSGRRTRAVIVTESDHIILASIQPETIAQRFRE